MPYSIIWSDDASTTMLALGKLEAKRIAEKVEAAAHDPQHYFKRLVGREDFRLRVGDYRIITQVHHPEKLIFVELVGHRKSIYKHLK